MGNLPFDPNRHSRCDQNHRAAHAVFYGARPCYRVGKFWYGAILYDRPAAGLPITPLPFRDTFAPQVGYSGAFPVAAEKDRAWMTHCYGIVGVARGLAPDTGSGGELYAVLGQSPRQLGVSRSTM